MTEIVIFHAVLGLRPAVLDFAETLRSHGHVVHTPDLWDGAVYDSIDDGVVHRDRVGIPALLEKAQDSVKGLPTGLVYMGFSLGAALAQALTQNRPGAKGAVFLHGVLPPEELGSVWPAGVPAQVHSMDRDSWEDIEYIREATEKIAAVAPAELFVYSGDGHLFLDAGLADDYDAEAAALATQRIVDFLAAL